MLEWFGFMEIEGEEKILINLDGGGEETWEKEGKIGDGERKKEGGQKKD